MLRFRCGLIAAIVLHNRVLASLRRGVGKLGADVGVLCDVITVLNLLSAMIASASGAEKDPPSAFCTRMPASTTVSL